MKILIRLLYKEESVLGLHCLPTPICPKIWDHYSNVLGFQLSEIPETVRDVILKDPAEEILQDLIARDLKENQEREERLTANSGNCCHWMAPMAES